MADGLSFDPATLPGTKLASGGPSALEVGFKRMGMEAQQDAQKAKQEQLKQAKRKPVDLSLETGWIHHTKHFGDVRKSLIDLNAQLYSNYAASGNNPDLDPEMPGTSAWHQLQNAKSSAQQQVANSNQIKDWYNVLRKDIETNKTKYRPDALDKINQVATDINYLSGESVLPTPDAFYDVEGPLTKAIESIEPSQTAYAYRDEKTGVMREGTKKVITDQEIMDAVSGEVRANQNLRDALLYEFSDLAKNDLEGAREIEAEAKANGWTIPEQMAYDMKKGAAGVVETAGVKGGFGLGDMTKQAEAGYTLRKFASLGLGNYEGLDEASPTIKKIFDIDPKDLPKDFRERFYVDTSPPSYLLPSLDEEGVAVKDYLGAVVYDAKTGKSAFLKQSQVDQIKSSSPNNVPKSFEDNLEWQDQEEIYGDVVIPVNQLEKDDLTGYQLKIIEEAGAYTPDGAGVDMGKVMKYLGGDFKQFIKGEKTDPKQKKQSQSKKGGSGVTWK